MHQPLQLKPGSLVGELKAHRMPGGAYRDGRVVGLGRGSG
jgi:hypothetical protein